MSDVQAERGKRGCRLTRFSVSNRRFSRLRRRTRERSSPMAVEAGSLQAFGGVAEDAKAVAGVGGGSVGRLRTENRATRRLPESSCLWLAKSQRVG
jgi:hypothetical protein